MGTVAVLIGIIWFAICIVVGANYASDHENVFERISVTFNKIFAFIIGFGFAAWVSSFIITGVLSLYAAVKAETSEPFLAFLVGGVPAFVIVFVLGILSIGAISNFIDMRKSLTQIAEDTAHLRELAAKQPRPGVSAGQSASPKLKRALQSTAPLGDTPEMTDEEKLAMAKQVAEEAIRKSREAKNAAPPTSEDEAQSDEETPTNP